jgi:hypothetical protein
MDKEDVRKLHSARITAGWSYIGALVPIVGWILGGISLSTLKAIDEPKTDKAKSRLLNVKKLAIGGIVLSTIIALLYGGLTAWSIQSTHKDQIAAQTAQQQAAYKRNLDQIGSLANQYLNVYQQWSSLPSSTTNSKAGWDSYYSGLSSQAKSIQSSSSANSYSGTALTTFNSSVQSACNDFINLLNLDQSNSDMQFQITSDQSQLTSDQNTLSGEENINNNGIAEGLPSDPSYVDEFETKVSNDKTQLSTDQQTLKSQQSQAGTLDLTVLGDTGKIRADGTKAGYHLAN